MMYCNTQNNLLISCIWYYILEVSYKGNMPTDNCMFSKNMLCNKQYLCRNKEYGEKIRVDTK